MVRWAVLLLLPAGTASGAENWIRLKSSNFELFTTVSEKRGREAIRQFEQVRGFFMAALKSSGTPLPVRIVGFSSEKEFRPYRPNETATAFYLPSHERDYIVMSGLGADRFPVAIHEYVHLLVRHSGQKLPVWLNEGLAEFYSTLTPIGNKARVGDLIPGHFHTLFQEKWLPLARVLEVDHSSPLYNERDRAGMFYSQSWALVHMLKFGPEYRPKSSAFFDAVHRGQAAREAFP